MNDSQFSNAVKLVGEFASEADAELKMLQAALAISPLPPRLAVLEPVLAEAQFAVGFLLRVDAVVLRIKTALGL